MQYPFTINPLPIRLGSNILDNEFDDDVLDTLVLGLVFNFNELELLGHKV